MSLPSSVRLSAVTFSVCLLALGCAEFNFTPAGRATLTYTDDAHAAYGEALDAFKARNWEDARVLFIEVKKLFGYSRYARLAELRLADIDFEQGKFTDAVAGYRDFVQNHRSDRDVEYARYRISKSLFNDIEDSFVLPPAEERDQATTNEAYRDLRNFLSDFPQSRYVADVKYMHDVVLQRLVRHEMYIARFYLRTENFDATIARIDHALAKYPGTVIDSEALVLKGETLLKMKKNEEARAVFERVVAEYATPFAVTAKRYLAQLGPVKEEPAKPAAPSASPAPAAPTKAAP